MSAEKIDIADLKDPVLTDIQRAALAAAEANPVPLTEAAVLGAAQAATGLSDFGDDGFRVRLRLWLKGTAEDPNLSAAGRAGIFMDSVRYASNRLRVEDLVKRHPEILDIEIDRPIVVAGLPRSGTTYLQSFLAADDRLRSLPFWEAVRPVPEEQAAAGMDDPRLVKAREEWAQYDALLPYIKSIHEFSPDHISEDIELQAVDFGSYYLEWLVMAPEWQEHYFATDQTPTYRYLKKMLQVLTWFKGPNRWLIKCPQHMEQLIPLTEVFPDATVVINHRDPTASIQSAITALCYSARIRCKTVQPDQVAEYWIQRYERLLGACVRDRGKLDDARVVDVYFHELMADPWKVIREIYRKAGLPLTDAAWWAMDSFVRNNPRGKHGQIVYDLRRDFGRTPDQIRARFGFYFDRFPVKAEVN
ncbi:MAG TPA: sulfotransferase [Alphaproteobacteria bacterium]|nr:sulfotransferase [Alphaproteobacteria bacterium]